MFKRHRHRRPFWTAASFGGFSVGAVGAVAAFSAFVSPAVPEAAAVVDLPAATANATEMVGDRERHALAASRSLERAKADYREQRRQERVEARAEAREVAREAREAEAEVASAPAPPAYPVSGNRAIGQELMLARWGMDQWQCLDALWTRESGWNHLAENTSSGAYGIPQSLPGDKMASAGDDWATNPATQIRWGLGYIAGRYGTPCGAWQHSESVGWY